MILTKVQAPQPEAAKHGSCLLNPAEVAEQARRDAVVQAAVEYRAARKLTPGPAANAAWEVLCREIDLLLGSE